MRLISALAGLLAVSSFAAATHCISPNQYWNFQRRPQGCSPCPPGQVSLTGESPICHAPCSTSQYWKNQGNNPGCKACPPGQSSQGGTDTSCSQTVINCSNEQFFDQGSNSCRACPPNYKSNGGRDGSCNIRITPPPPPPTPSCSTNEYLCGESHTCKRCPDGQTSTGGSASFCSPPPPRSPPPSNPPPSTFLTCPPNQFINRKLFGQKKCKPCPVGATSRGGDVDSCDCPTGKSWSGILDLCYDRCLLPNQDFSPSENRCVCSPGFSFCNGGCRRSCSTVGISKRSTIESKAKECEAKRGHSFCPVVGTSGWECVDALSGLETCGGCALPPNHLNVYASSTSFTDDESFRFIGEDCSAIAHSDTVSCLNGSCLVESCEKGFVPNEGHNACVAA